MIEQYHDRNHNRAYDLEVILIPELITKIHVREKLGWSAKAEQLILRVLKSEYHHYTKTNYEGRFN